MQRDHARLLLDAVSHRHRADRTKANVRPNGCLFSVSVSVCFLPVPAGTLASASVAVLFLALAAAYYLSTPPSSVDPASDDPASDAALRDCVSVAVPRFEFNEEWNRLSYPEIARLRQPLILHGSALVTQQWPASRTDAFSPTTLIRRFPRLPSYNQSAAQRSFATFHEEKPLEQLSGLQRDRFNRKVQAEARCVLRADAGEKSVETADTDSSLGCPSGFQYFSLRFSSLPADMLSAIQPLSPLLLWGNDSTRAQQNLWLGRTGLITHTHFDLQHNFFVQISGAKRFTLFAPDAQLRLYPNLHPHQAHVWSAPSVRPEGNSSCSGFEGTAAVGNPKEPHMVRYVAELRAGDVLVVPPLWFHHVETLSRSVSVNVWSDAEELTQMDRVYALPVPLESDWPLADRVSATLYYLRRVILATVCGRGLMSSEGNRTERLRSKLVRQWMQRWIIEARYHTTTVKELARNSGEDSAKIRQQCGELFAPHSLALLSRWQTAEHEPRWQRGLVPLAAEFDRLHALAQRIVPSDAPAWLHSEGDPRLLDQQDAIRSLLLANYAEWLIVALVGDKELVRMMICLH